MATLIPAKQIEFESQFSGSTAFEDVFISGSLLVSQSFILGSSAEDINQISSSIEMTGSMILSGELNIGDISIYPSVIQFTNNGDIVGSITASSDGLIINGTLFTDSYVIGNYSGSGDNLFFTRVGTNEPNDSIMIIGNYYNDYENKQTTVFQNGDVIVSGSVEITNNGYLILNPLNTPPTIDNNKGGLYYSTDGYYYLISPI
jgi:hypothetical protein